VWIYTGNKLAHFHRNRLSLSENIAKSFRGGLLFFDSHCRRHNLKALTNIYSKIPAILNFWKIHKPKKELLLRSTCRFSPSSSHIHCQYSFWLPVEGWPGWVDLDKHIHFTYYVFFLNFRNTARNDCFWVISNKSMSDASALLTLQNMLNVTATSTLKNAGVTLYTERLSRVLTC